MKSSEYLAGFLGNERVLLELGRLLDTGRFPHAVLLTGEDGCGRNALARRIARALLGDTADLVTRGTHPDCLLVEGEGASCQITVRRIREAAYELQKSPVMNELHRVAIVRNAASLNRSSSNALLKTLEQPPAGVVFLLTARSESELLETILSRCVRFRVEPLTEAQCREAVRQRFPALDKARLASLCAMYGGRLGLVEAALRAPERLAICDLAQQLYSACLRRDKLQMLSALDAAADKPSLKALLCDFTLLLESRLRQEPQRAPLFAALADSAAAVSRDLDRNGQQKLLCTRFVLCISENEQIGERT